MSEVYERLLPTIQELASGDFIRVVDSIGRSVKIPQDKLASGYKSFVNFVMFTSVGVPISSSALITPGTELYFEERSLVSRFILNYRWVVLDGTEEVLVSFLRNPVFTFDNTGTFSVKLELYDDYGRLVTSVTKADSVVVAESVYTVQIKVLELGTENPISGALVTLGSEPGVYTDVTGLAVISTLVSGTVVYTVSMNGYEAYQGTVTIPQSVIPEEALLTPSEITYSVVFSVKDSSNSPLVTAEVTIMGISPPVVGYTDSLGRVQFFDIPAGEYSFFVNKANYTEFSGSITVPTSGTISVILESTVQVLSAYIGYVSNDQYLATGITEEIILASSPGDQNEFLNDLTQPGNYPSLIKLFHKHRWPSLDPMVEIHMWVAVPQAWGVLYTHYNDSAFPSAVWPLTTFGTNYGVSSISLDGEAYSLYRIYFPPSDFHLGVSTGAFS